MGTWENIGKPIGKWRFTRPGKLLHNELERSTMLFTGKFTVNGGSFHSYVKLPEGISILGHFSGRSPWADTNKMEG